MEAVYNNLESAAEKISFIRMWYRCKKLVPQELKDFNVMYTLLVPRQ